MRGVFLLILLALLASLVALPQPTRLSGVRSLADPALALPTFNLVGLLAARIWGFPAAPDSFESASPGLLTW